MYASIVRLNAALLNFCAFWFVSLWQFFRWCLQSSSAASLLQSLFVCLETVWCLKKFRIAICNWHFATKKYKAHCTFRASPYLIAQLIPLMRTSHFFCLFSLPLQLFTINYVNKSAKYLEYCVYFEYYEFFNNVCFGTAQQIIAIHEKTVNYRLIISLNAIFSKGRIWISNRLATSWFKLVDK